MRRLITAAAAVAMALATAGGAGAAGTVGTSFPAGFPTILDSSLGTPLIGFGAAGPVFRTPVVFVHGNNDTPFPTLCNPLGYIHSIAQYLADHGYSPGELWGIGYQGDQCDLVADPLHRSGEAHSTVANVPDLDRFVRAVLAFTHARRVDIVGHSLGVTLAREWMRARPRNAPRPPPRRRRRAEPRHRQLLAVTAQLLRARAAGRLHAGERDLPRVRRGGHAVPDAAEPR